MVCAVLNGNKLPDENGLVSALTEAEPSIKSILINVNKEKTNVILGKTCRTLWGEDYITDILCGLTFRISPLSFYQVNRDQAEKLYNKAAEYANLSGNETVLDLYCGAGTIGLSMASKAKEIIGVEIVPEAIEDAKLNAQINGVTNARFLCGDAAEAAEILRNEGIRPDVIILDPPRKGCSPEMINTAAQMNPERIVYVSCDPATLARDCGIFADLGYTAVKATPVDMFPRTGHIETVVQLSQRKADANIDIDLDLDELDITASESKATHDEIKG
jgi:23S rRNA (uracil1939-C5)-methyltransferase